MKSSSMTWIPCSEKLPEPKIPVLFFIPVIEGPRKNPNEFDSFCRVGYRVSNVDGKHQFSDGLLYFQLPPSHWMPLPALPISPFLPELTQSEWELMP